MARDDKRIYREHDPVKITLRIVLAVVAVLVVFAVFLFFFFQRFIVYTPEGLKLDIAGYYSGQSQDEQEAPLPSPDVSVIWN